jgi:hypothetical protein
VTPESRGRRLAEEGVGRVTEELVFGAGRAAIDDPVPAREPRFAGEDSMPFKSKAQRRKFAELLVKGEISPETFEEWNRETGRKVLPERVAKKTRATKKVRVTKKKRPL